MFRRSIHALLLVALGAQGCGTAGQPRVIYLARHGQTEWNRKAQFQGDPDLDSVGYINRVSLWRLLKKRPVHAVYTSERLRTRRTAELVALQHKVKIQPRAALNEIDPGIFTGLCFSQLEADPKPHSHDCVVAARGSKPEATLEKLRPLFKKVWKDRINGKWPLGQSFTELTAQVKSFVAELGQGYHARRVLVVGHGVVNRSLLHHLMGWPLKNVTRLRQENDQVYKLVSKGGRTRLFMFAPGRGWKPCLRPPKAGDRHLDCHPPGEEDAAEKTPPPAPARDDPPPPMPPTSQPKT